MKYPQWEGRKVKTREETIYMNIIITMTIISSRAITRTSELALVAEYKEEKKEDSMNFRCQVFCVEGNNITQNGS